MTLPNTGSDAIDRAIKTCRRAALVRAAQRYGVRCLCPPKPFNILRLFCLYPLFFIWFCLFVLFLPFRPCSICARDCAFRSAYCTVWPLYSHLLRALISSRGSHGSVRTRPPHPSHALHHARWYSHGVTHGGAPAAGEVGGATVMRVWWHSVAGGSGSPALSWSSEVCVAFPTCRAGRETAGLICLGRSQRPALSALSGRCRAAVLACRPTQSM